MGLLHAIAEIELAFEIARCDPPELDPRWPWRDVMPLPGGQMCEFLVSTTEESIAEACASLRVEKMGDLDPRRKIRGWRDPPMIEDFARLPEKTERGYDVTFGPPESFYQHPPFAFLGRLTLDGLLRTVVGCALSGRVPSELVFDRIGHYGHPDGHAVPREMLDEVVFVSLGDAGFSLPLEPARLGWTDQGLAKLTTEDGVSIEQVRAKSQNTGEAGHGWIVTVDGHQEAFWRFDNAINKVAWATFWMRNDLPRVAREYAEPACSVVLRRVKALKAEEREERKRRERNVDYIGSWDQDE